MPFTPPTTVASLANTGYEAIFEFGSPLAGVAEVKSFNVTPITMAEVPTTTLLSPNNTEEFIPSMIKPGKLTFSGNFTGVASQLDITTLAQAQTIFAFNIVAPVQQNTHTYTLAGKGFFSSYKVGPFENNKAVEFEAEIQMTGSYTEVIT